MNAVKRASRVWWWAPPEIEVSSELEWVFLRSLGDTSRTIGQRIDPDEALKLAMALGLAPRIGGRLSRDFLESELTPTVAAVFRQQYRLAAAQTLILETVASELEKEAANEGVRLVRLKGLALGEAGVISFGLRPMSDVDLLVDLDMAHAFWRFLRGRGYTTNGSSHREHHLAPLVAPWGAKVELHTRLFGVRVRESHVSACLEDLDAERLLEKSDSGLSLRLDVVVAHVLIHALLHHRFDVAGYPPARVLCDVADFVSECPSALDQALLRLHKWSSGRLTADHGRAVVTAVSRLQEEPLAAGRGDDNAALIVRHVFAANIDERYKRRMHRRHLAWRLSDRSWIGATTLRALKTTRRFLQGM